MTSPQDILRGRAIVIFPRLSDPEPIADLRRRYDPLVDLIEPHITLVFPFESDMPADELRAHVQQSVHGIGPFPIRLASITGMADQYLFLNVKRGNDELIALHDRLYTGPLAKFLSLEFTFVPHVTVGRLPNRDAMLEALAIASKTRIEIETRVEVISVYTAAPTAVQPIESEIPLS